MSSQVFSAKSFGFLARQGDYWGYFKDSAGKDSKTIKKETLQEVEDNLNVENYTFQPFHTFIANKKPVYALPRILKDNSNRLAIISDDFILRKVNHNLQRIYKVKQADRFQIISNVKTLLTNPAPFYVGQLDIKSFYESVDRSKILSDIESSAIVSYQTKALLRKFFSTLDLQKGLPRGVNISATLAEYCLKKFDRKVAHMNSVYYYARFVDDMIIFSTDPITRQMIKEVASFLPEGLEQNISKKRLYDFSKNEVAAISYLGYEFKCAPLIKKKGSPKREIKTRISKKKANKIKGRIVSSFLAYKRDNDFNLLKDRLLFLTATYPLKTQRKKLSKFENAGFLHGGILYSYPLIDDLSCLSELDVFLCGLLFSKSMKKRITSTLTATQREELKKFSFLQGYSRRISRKFRLDHIGRITECWQ